MASSRERGSAVRRCRGRRRRLAAHRADLDVVVVVLAGSATAEVDGRAIDLGPGTAVVVPAGATRAVAAGAGGARYLTVHGRRGARDRPAAGAGRTTAAARLAA